MSENIEQIYVANPITTNASTDLMYFGQSPYGAGDDAAMQFVNFNAQIVANGTANQLGYYASTGNKISPITGANNGVLITSNSGVPSWLANGTPGYILVANSGAPPSWQSPASVDGSVLLAPSGAQTINTYPLNVNGGVYTPEILDSNGANLLTFTTITNAVNYISIFNNTTTMSPILIAMGSDTNIGIGIRAKGTSPVTLQNTGTNVLTVNSGAVFQHTTVIDFPTTAAAQTVTFPDATGTVTLLGNTSTGTGSVVLANTPTLITPVLGAATATSINFGGSSLANYVATTAWTPVFTFATPGNLSVVYSAQNAYYIRIGNLIQVNFWVGFTPTYTTASGAALITGLPVASNASTNNVSVGALTSTGLSAGAASLIPLAEITAGSSSININGQTLGGSSANLTTTSFVSGGAYLLIGSISYMV